MPASACNSTGSRLLDLPGELRNVIYRYALLDERPVQVSAQSGFHELGLLKVSKAVRADTASIYYHENVFVMRIERYNSDLLLRWTKKLAALRRRSVKIQPAKARAICSQRDWGNLQVWIERLRTIEIVNYFDITLGGRISETEENILAGLFRMAVECRELSVDAFARILATQRAVLGSVNKAWLD